MHTCTRCGAPARPYSDHCTPCLNAMSAAELGGRISRHAQARADGITARMVAVYWHCRTMGSDVWTSEGEALAVAKHSGMQREECRRLLRAAVRERKALAALAVLAVC